MKPKFIIALLVITLPLFTNAQLRGLMNKVKNKIDQRVGPKVDQQIDKTLDEVPANYLLLNQKSQNILTLFCEIQPCL